MTNNEISRVVALIPLIGYFIIFNDSVAAYLSFDLLAGADDTVASPFWISSLVKLRLAFFGAISLFVGTAIFLMLRPPVLDFAKSDLSFADRVLSGYAIEEIQAMEVDVDNKTSWSLCTTLIEQYTREDANGERGLRFARAFGRQVDLVRAHGEYTRALSREWYTGQVARRPFARMLSVSCAIVGYVLLAIPTIDIFQAVLRDITF
ncbi:hypothetical protein [Gymnodinialimonas ceratoperidinii]|uniref:Uncharacterized protein n=1 Tax=Gymnodinialimonas ceratoperidinii TaxID=2856823 RepID=A0A8F6YA65_9RHOB|nr:hypothetical protein [Gymnodinialimonas ceratoperidinii]QXT38661.1 hypothetical protein KYE46_12030 [Gymnodinialimonas ceratoperidinii]